MTDTKHTPELLPCPFCGGQASDRGEVTYHGSHEAWWPDGSQVVHAYYCNCIRCGITSKGIIGQQTRELAREKWNQRAGMPDPAAEIAALRSELDEWKARCSEIGAALKMALADHMTEPYLHPLRDGTIEAIKCAIARAAIEEE